MSTEPGPERFQVLTVVELLLEAIRDGDRRSIARRATGPLLRQLLSGESEPAYARLREATLRGLSANPVAAVDGDHAVVMGAVTGSDHGPIPLVAILIRTEGDSWLVAELDRTAAADPGRLMAAVLGRTRDPGPGLDRREDHRRRLPTRPARRGDRLGRPHRGPPRDRGRPVYRRRFADGAREPRPIGLGVARGRGPDVHGLVPPCAPSRARPRAGPTGQAVAVR